MILRYRQWPAGIQFSDGAVHFAGQSVSTTLAESAALRAYWGGCLRRMFDLLPAGPVQVLGADGIESWVSRVAELASRTLRDDAHHILDVGAVLLDTPARFGEVADEAVIVIAIHPERAPQSFDFYSTIHRHSLTVKLVAWELSEPLQELADLEVAPSEGGAWLLTDG